MDIRETVSVAIDALRANKLRAILTSLGVIIGSASIVLVVTVALTSKKFVLSQIESVGSNLVWVELVQRPDKPQPLSYEMTLEDLEAVKAIPNVIEVAGTRELETAVVVDGVERPVHMVGVTEGYQVIRRLLILRGRYFDAADMEMRSKVCLITTQLADRIFGQENPIGRSMRMGELTFTVIGVFRERVETFGLSDIQENSVILPFSLMKYYTGMEVVRLLDAQSANADGDPERGEEYLAGVDHRAHHHCVHCAGDQRNRHYEHHAGDGDGTDAGDRDPQGDWSGAARDHVSVPDRVVRDQRRRRGHRDIDRDRHTGGRAVFPAGKSARSGFGPQRGDRVCGVVLHGTFLRLPAGEPGGQPATGRVVEI